MTNMSAKNKRHRISKVQKNLTPLQRQKRQVVADQFFRQVTLDPHYNSIVFIPPGNGPHGFGIWLPKVCELTGLLPGEIANAIRRRDDPSLTPFPSAVVVNNCGKTEMVWLEESVMAWLFSNPAHRCWIWPVASLTWRPRSASRRRGMEHFQVVAPWWAAKERTVR